MTTQQEILLIVGMIIVTFSVRYPVLALVGRLDLPEPVVKALRYVPVAVLTAITVPAMIMPDDGIDFSLNNAYLVAGIFAIGIAFRTKRLLPTIGIGMVIFIIWRALTGQM